MAIEQFDLDPYDLVISSSHCAAKAVVAPGRARHLCYCHSPMRYAWDQFDAYFGPARAGRFASRWVYRPALARLARWDASTADRVHRFVANSAHVAGRIRRYYNRLATIVYPPVDTIFFHPADVPPGSHFLIVSALVPYKRIELAMAACDRLGAPLRIVGDGPDRARLDAQAGRNVEFVGHSVTRVRMNIGAHSRSYCREEDRYRAGERRRAAASGGARPRRRPGNVDRRPERVLFADRTSPRWRRPSSGPRASASTRPASAKVRGGFPGIVM
jgi:glycosyltransferase involved in cell wall biosynthesis